MTKLQPDLLTPRERTCLLPTARGPKRELVRTVRRPAAFAAGTDL